MSERTYFQQALGNFTRDVANGGAIRHLADLGYTVNQIAGQLAFPAPTEQIQRDVWKRLLETGVILTECPGSAPLQKADYVREYDRFGRPSFRQVVHTSSGPAVSGFRSVAIPLSDPAGACDILREKIEENGEEFSYAACDFGLLSHQNPALLQVQLAALQASDRDYVEELPWENKRVWHRLNSRMQEILFSLLNQDLWEGDCCFIGTGETISFSR